MKRLALRLSGLLRERGDLLAVIHNAGWLFADKALRMLVGVAVGAWVARYLGPSQFGEVSYVLSFVAFFSGIAQLGLDGVAVRDMARDEGQAAAILGTSLWMRALTGVAAWLAAIVLMSWLRPGDSDALTLTAIAGSTLVLQASDTLDLWFQTKTQSKRTIIAKGYAYLAANALKVGLVLLEAPLAAFVLVGAVELAIAAAIMWQSYRRFPAPTPLRIEWSRAARLLRESTPYMTASLAVLVYMRIDQLMLRELVGEHELGLYSAALPLSGALHFVPIACCTSIAPLMSRLRQRNVMQYERAVAYLFSAMWWSMIPMAVLVAVLAPAIIAFLYGPAYAASAPMLAVHVFSAVPVALGVAQSVWIVNEGRNMISLYRTVAGAACNVALNLLLIPRYGGVGAAVAAVAAQAVAAIFSNVLLAPRMLRIQLSSLIARNIRQPSK